MIIIYHESTQRCTLRGQYKNFKDNWIKGKSAQVQDNPLPITASYNKYGEKALQLILKHGNCGQYEYDSHGRKTLRYLFEKVMFWLSNQLLFLLFPKIQSFFIIRRTPQQNMGKISLFFQQKYNREIRVL